jgi:hypothetical protein
MDSPTLLQGKAGLKYRVAEGSRETKLPCLEEAKKCKGGCKACLKSVIMVLTLQDPLVYHDHSEDKTEGVLLAEPDFRWPEDETVDEVYPPYVKESAGKPACCLNICCCCGCPERLSCTKIHKAYKEPTRPWKDILRPFLIFTAPFLSLHFENQRSRVLGVINLVSTLLIIMVCTTPVANIRLAGGNCESAFAYSPTYKSYYFGETMKNYTAINKEQYKLDALRKSDEYNSLEWEESEKIEANQQKLYKDYVRHSGGWEKSDFGESNNTLVKSLRYFPNSSRLGLPDEYKTSLRCDETSCSSEEMDYYAKVRSRQDSYQYDSFSKPRGFNFFDKQSKQSNGELLFNIDSDDPETDLKETYTVSKFLFHPASDNKHPHGKGTNEHSLDNAVDNCKRACQFGNLDAITRAMEINPDDETCGVFTSAYGYSYHFRSTHNITTLQKKKSYLEDFKRATHLSGKSKPLNGLSSKSRLQKLVNYYLVPEDMINSIPRLLRIAFVGLANSKTARTHGWGGIFFLSAVVVDIIQLATSLGDVINFCPAIKIPVFQATTNLSTYTCEFNEDILMKNAYFINKTSGLASSCHSSEKPYFCGPFKYFRNFQQQLERHGFKKKEKDPSLHNASTIWTKNVPLKFASIEKESRRKNDVSNVIQLISGSFVASFISGLERRKRMIEDDRLSMEDVVYKDISTTVGTPFQLEKEALNSRQRFYFGFGSVWILLNWLNIASLFLELTILFYVFSGWLWKAPNIFCDKVCHKKCRNAKDEIRKAWNTTPCKRERPNQKSALSSWQPKFYFPIRVTIAAGLAFMLLVCSAVQLFTFWDAAANAIPVFEDQIAASVDSLVKKTGVMGSIVLSKNIGKNQNPYRNTKEDMYFKAFVGVAEKLDLTVNSSSTSMFTKTLQDSFNSCLIRSEMIYLVTMKLEKQFIDTYSNVVGKALRATSTNKLSMLNELMQDTAVEFISPSNVTANGCEKEASSIFLEAKSCLISSLKNVSFDNFTEAPATVHYFLNETCPEILCARVLKTMGETGANRRGAVDGTTIIKEILESKAAKDMLTSIPGVDPEFVNMMLSNEKGERLGLLFEILESVLNPSGRSGFSLDNAQNAISKIRTILKGLENILRMGGVAAWVAFFISLCQIFAFLKRVYWIGYNQLSAVLRLYDPVAGYNNAIQSNEMTLKDLVLLRGIYFTKREMRHIVANAGEQDDKAQLARRRYMGKKLRYVNLTSSSMFIGVYPFSIVLSFVVNSFFVWLLLCLLGIPIYLIMHVPNWPVYFAAPLYVILPLLLLIITKALVLCCIKDRLGLAKASHHGPSHIGSLGVYDGVFTLFGAIVGFAPAIVRIVGALLIGVVKVSRLDTPLSYTSLDSPHRFFLGVLEEMRMRVEYRVRQRWFVEQRKKNSLRKKNKNSWGGLETGSVKVSANNIAASKINAEISFEMTKHKEMSGIGTALK